MIRITNIRNANSSFDENWAIVRSLKSNSQLLTQVTDLAPSFNLFLKFQELKKRNDWNFKTFESIYVPQFIYELRNNPDAIKRFEYLYTQDKLNKNICLVCFCTDETLCHRSIIAGILAGGGCDVKTDTQNDYRKYYAMYMA